MTEDGKVSCGFCWASVGEESERTGEIKKIEGVDHYDRDTDPSETLPRTFGA
uniref:Uncharacterized protein n=1 Tax=Candidatus Kentrum sp. TUN TaxID=2126343 RepID=A0A450ZR48_9GAMM|nr:MAG: hypothetical protein BECKTUN1418F_GA0071002_108416 [Candidatus Kentron sp. TUN]VFK62397.1 MAG: hypothetical protein BECKTUN1418E_GA0071001_107917 [Candidatus Kentron sp. TUN]